VTAPDEAHQRRVRQAARALGRHGLAHAYGHVSIRIDAGSFLVCAPEPMGLIAPGTPGTVVPIDGDLPDGVLGEVRVHREIYRSRPGIAGVARSMPPKIMSLSTLRLTPRPRHGFGSYFYPEIPLWDDPLLVRSDEAARALVARMGDSRAIVMRGNGLVTAGESPEEAVVRAWYAEDAARVELDVLSAGDSGNAALITADEARVRATWSGRILERMWDYLTNGDPE
jgi:HCOMODA/2-hydroxy-3-carboxy-muconic semialdehyde decarboxylase